MQMYDTDWFYFGEMDSRDAVQQLVKQKSDRIKFVDEKSTLCNTTDSWFIHCM